MLSAHIWLEQAKVFAANASSLCDLADTLLEGFKLLVERGSGSGDNLSDCFATAAEPLLLKLLQDPELKGSPVPWQDLITDGGKPLAFQSVGYKKGQL